MRKAVCVNRFNRFDGYYRLLMSGAILAIIFAVASFAARQHASPSPGVHHCVRAFKTDVLLSAIK